jgi:hypothetical protein
MSVASTAALAWAVATPPSEPAPEESVEIDAAAVAPGAPEPAQPVSPSRNDQWQEDYSRARRDLIAGRFAEAAQQFRALARTARDAFDQKLALDQAELAATWSDRNLRLTLATGDAEASPATSNRRTTDEISILYTNAAVYGIASGITLAVITEPDSAAGGILPTLTLAGAALGAVALVDASPHELDYGVPQSIVSGMYILAVSWFATSGMAGDRGPTRTRETSLTQALRPTFSPTRAAPCSRCRARSRGGLGRVEILLGLWGSRQGMKEP